MQTLREYLEQGAARESVIDQLGYMMDEAEDTYRDTVEVQNLFRQQRMKGMSDD